MLSQTRLNAYRIMWLFVFFDLPVETKKQRKAATDFRKSLIKDGFTMLQFSVYTRHCASDESADAHLNGITRLVPDYGHVSILKVTDKQYGNIVNIWGQKKQPLRPAAIQIELF